MHVGRDGGGDFGEDFAGGDFLGFRFHAEGWWRLVLVEQFSDNRLGLPACLEAGEELGSLGIQAGFMQVEEAFHGVGPREAAVARGE
jgi:hypothetical protein